MVPLPHSLIGVALLGVLIPVLAIIAVPAIIIAVLYFRHRERMAYLSRPPYAPPQPDPAPAGQEAEAQTPPPPPGAYGYPYGYPYARPATYRHHPALYHPIARACRLIGVGLGISIGLLPLGANPALLAGLIPLFVGLIRLGELYISPGGPQATAQDRELWLHRSLWSGGIGLALMLGILTLGFTPAILVGSVPFGYGAGLLLAHYLSRITR